MFQRVFLIAALAVACLLLAVCIFSPRRERRERRVVPMSDSARRERKEWGIVPVLEKDEVDSLMKAPTVQELTAAIEKLRPLHKEKGPVRPGDWLEGHPEPGQSFREYLGINPVTPRGKRNTLYIQPLGEFSEAQRKVVTLTADFMGRYFNLPVKIKDDLPLSLIPDDARRVHPSWGDSQILTTYVLDKVLRPCLPDDAAACIAFTTSDLWPGEGWNFVFGQASLRARIGVWSIYRFGNPELDDDQFRRTLLRTMKVATHETGHMFSMLHCTAYECNMCGSNSLPETDRQPLCLCPECMAKACWATQTSPVQRYRKLAEFCKTSRLKREQEFYEQSVKELSGKKD